MLKIRSGFFVGLLLGAIFSFIIANASEHETSQPEPTLGFKISGNDYLPKGSNFRIGYVLGSLDAFLLSVHRMSTGKQVFNFNDCMANWSKHELIFIVEQYMRENSDEQNHSAALLTHKALKAKCQIQSPSAKI